MNLNIKVSLIIVLLVFSYLFGQETDFILPEFPTPPVMEIPAVTPDSDEIMQEALKASPEIDEKKTELSE
jgi:hypothetical protein